jgi:hypothetical protein
LYRGFHSILEGLLQVGLHGTAVDLISACPDLISSLILFKYSPSFSLLVSILASNLVSKS